MILLILTWLARKIARRHLGPFIFCKRFFIAFEIATVFLCMVFSRSVQVCHLDVIEYQAAHYFILFSKFRH